MTALDVIELVSKVLAVCAAALLFSTFVAVSVGTWLAERSRGYRLPYEPFEQSCHVRTFREDENA